MLKTAAQTLAKPLPNVANSIIGEVVGTSLPKTIKVRVGRVKIHPLVQKPVVFHKNFLAHDENNVCVKGDIVRINPCKKLSNRKNHTFAEVLIPASKYNDPETGIVYSQRKHSWDIQERKRKVYAGAGDIFSLE